MKFHICLLLSACAALTSAAVNGTRGPPEACDCSSKYVDKFPGAPKVPDSYLVTLKKSSNVDKHLDSVASLFGKPRARVIHDNDLGKACGCTDGGQYVQAQFTHAEKFTYVASIYKDTLKKLLRDGDVELVEPNYYVKAQKTAVQFGAPWGLSRLSNQVRLSIDDRTVYNFLDHSTANVDVYVIDSGINIDHEEFGGRAVNAANFVTGESNNDLFGHGTHVAGTIGGKTFGVAKQVQIHNVKILAADGTGSNAGVLAGINFVISEKEKNPHGRFVINMSIGGPQSTAEEDAIRAAIKAGIHVVVAAGNNAMDACSTSPASSNKDGAIVVGATSSKDVFASFSNFGTCVDVLAPGVDILSAWNKGPKTVHVLQGTSMASPHVAGLVASWYARDKGLNPTKMKARVIQFAQSGKISGVTGATPNKMVWNGL